MTNADLFAAVRAWVASNYPGDAGTEVIIRLACARVLIRLPVPAPAAGAPVADLTPADWIPTDNQVAILEALEGRGLKGDALAVASNVDRRQMFRELEELKRLGKVAHRARVGYFRPDAPPEVLEESTPPPAARRTSRPAPPETPS